MAARRNMAILDRLQRHAEPRQQAVQRLHFHRHLPRGRVGGAARLAVPQDLGVLGARVRGAEDGAAGGGGGESNPQLMPKEGGPVVELLQWIVLPAGTQSVVV